MKTRMSLKTALSLLMAIVMMFSIMTPAMAAGLDFNKDYLTTNADFKLTSKTDYSVAPGITESHIITHRKDGTNQVQSFALEIDLNNPNVGVLASYKGYMNNLADSPSWGLQTVRDQATAAENYYQPSNPNFKVVGGINGDFFNMQTGAPTGPLVMNGKVYNTNAGWPYFAILNDGTPVIRAGGGDYSDVKEAIGGPNIIVKDGQITPNAYGDTAYYPRTTIGIKADGKIVFITADGRQAPTSCGQTLVEVAQQMISLGCVDAIQLDGGGSATIVSKHEGEESLSVRNSPSDGVERIVSTAWLVYSTAAPSGTFDHANLYPNNELYTPESTVQFSATGADTSGAAVDLPADGTFSLANAAAGTIDSETGLFTAAAGFTGDVTVNYMVGEQVKGSTTVSIVMPDTLYLGSAEQAVGPGLTTDFGLVAKYQDRDINMKAGDLVWAINDASTGADLAGTAGTFTGLTFTAAEDGAYNAKVNVNFKGSETLKHTITVFIGSKQVTWFDFEYTTDAEEAADPTNNLKYIKDYTLPTYGKAWLTANGESNGSISAKIADDFPLYMWPNGALDNDTVTATIVDKADGEPVRVGNKALRIQFDFSTYNYSSNANFYLRGTAADYNFEGSPTAIGAWVYAPEGTAGYALYLQCARQSGAGSSYQAVANANNISDWKYVEFDLTGTKGMNGSYVGSSYEPYGHYQGNGVFWISYQPASMGTPTADTIYLDDITIIYGANTSDTINPEVNYIGDLVNDMVDGETVYTSNTNTFRAKYSDVEDKYMTGIDDSKTKMYIDGVDVTSKCYINEGDDEILFYDAYLANGIHSIEIEVTDNNNNTTTETRYFTVNGEAQETELSFAKVNEPVLGSDYKMAITSNNPADVTAVDAEVIVLSGYRSYWRNVTVEPAANYQLVGTPNYNIIRDTLSFKVERKADADTALDDGTIATIVTAVPSDTPENLEVTHRLTKGAVTYASTKADAYANGFSGKLTATCGAAFTIKVEPMVVGSQGGYIYVTDVDGNPAEGVEVKLTDETLIGTTDAEGKVFTDKFISAVASFSIYAVKGEERSFIYTGQSYNAGGDETGLPKYVKLNAVEDSSTMQNITWMASPIASGADVVVKYATKAAYEADGEAAFTTASGKSYVAEIKASGNVATNYAARFNSAVLTGLTPATEYVYIVGDGTNFSAVKTFTTDRKGESTNFFVIGDAQTENTGNITAISDALIASGKDYSFLIQTGDAVDNGGDFKYWTAIGEAFSADFIGATPMLNAFGNHEYTGDALGSNAAHFFNQPGTTDDSAPVAYTVQYGNVFVAVFNYNSSSDYAAAAEWIKEEAKAAKANWKVIAMHEPPYFTNVAAGSATDTEVISSLVDEAGFDVVFSGHDHAYARTYPIKGGVQDADGAVYYICAAITPEKGYQVTKMEGIHEIATNEYNSIYLTVEATDTDLKIVTYNYDGTNHNEFDRYTITKTVDCTADGHDYALDGDYLTCTVCGYTIAATGYNGIVKDAATSRVVKLVNGAKETSKWIDVDGSVYYLGADGVAVAGEQTIGGYSYPFDDNGKLTKFAFVLPDGTLKKNAWNNREYLGADGLYVTGVQKIDGRTYTFDNEGNFVKGALVKEGNHTYYYIAGETQRNWHLIDGYWHYFDRKTGSDGKVGGMATADNADKVSGDVDRTDGKYTISNSDGSYLLFTFDKNGRLIGGAWSETKEGTVYYWGNNERFTGWHYIDGEIYYFGADFYMVTGEQTIDETVYTFAENGALQLKEKNFKLADLYYYYDANGKIAKDHITTHEYVKSVLDAEKPDCTNTGLTAGEKCANCDFILVKQNKIDALGHTEEVIPAVAPKCTETGLTEGKKCTVCGEITVKQTTVDALGHDYVAVVTDATCTAKGFTTYTCSVCGDSYIDNYTDALGHDGEWIVVKEAQVGIAGLKQLVCKVCEEVLDEEVIAALEEPSTDDDEPVVSTGDINADGEITAADARLILRMAAKLDNVTDPALLAAADLNKDGVITADDARIALRIAAKLESIEDYL